MKKISKPKNLAKAALMSPLFREKEHGKPKKYYDRKKEKKVDLREKVLAKLMEENEKTYDVLHSLKGDKHIQRHLKTFKSEDQAKDYCRKLSNLPKGTIHYAITCDDGRTIHDSSKDGLLKNSH